MILKIHKTADGAALLKYVFQDKKSPDVLAGTTFGVEQKQVYRELREAVSARPNIGKPYLHATISLAHEGHLERAQWAEMTHDFMKKMGFERCPYVAVEHHDCEHKHIHIVASRISHDRKLVSQSHDFKRGERLMRQFERRYNLRQLECSWEKNNDLQRPTQGELHRAKRCDKQAARDHIRHSLDTAHKQRDVASWMHELARNGVQIHPKLTRDESKVTGVYFEHEDVKVAGSRVRRRYSWNKIKERVGFEPGKHLEWLKEGKAPPTRLTVQQTLEQMAGAMRARGAQFAPPYQPFDGQLQGIKRSDEHTIVLLHNPTRQQYKLVALEQVALRQTRLEPKNKQLAYHPLAATDLARDDQMSFRVDANQQPYLLRDLVGEQQRLHKITRARLQRSRPHTHGEQAPTRQVSTPRTSTSAMATGPAAQQTQRNKPHNEEEIPLSLRQQISSRGLQLANAHERFEGAYAGQLACEQRQFHMVVDAPTRRALLVDVHKLAPDNPRALSLKEPVRWEPEQQQLRSLDVNRDAHTSAANPEQPPQETRPSFAQWSHQMEQLGAQSVKMVRETGRAQGRLVSTDIELQEGRFCALERRGKRLTLVPHEERLEQHKGREIALRYRDQRPPVLDLKDQDLER